MREPELIPTILVENPSAAPEWALAERRLLDGAAAAAQRFVERYTHDDGSLVWRARWPGMDGADDAYESFFRFALVAALGGGAALLELARRQWESVTWQWTQYGQIHDEFFAYYDWMHHGEANLYLYYLGLADPASLRFRHRSIRFADLYAADDAANFDRGRRVMRSPYTGSLGPRTRVAAEDWETHRWILDMYPPPFDDLPATAPPSAPRLPGPEAATAIPLGRPPRSNWTDDDAFAEILERINARMVRGDVPLNLNATSLVANAFMHTGDDRYRDWVGDYFAAWRERTDANGGLTPDNVGLSGEIGEYTGDWWGGFFGYRWPHGFFTVYEPLAIAAGNVTLLTGDVGALDLPRSQLDLAWARGIDVDGVRMIPQRFVDGAWVDPAPPEPDHAIWLWAVSQDDDDRERVGRALPPEHEAALSRNPAADGRRGPYSDSPYSDGLETASARWFQYLHGDRPNYPMEILAADEATVERRLAALESDATPPELMDIHHWQDRVPVRTEALVQLTMGASLPAYHGGLLQASIRWFDAHERRPGLPVDVAVLVERISSEGIVLTVCNVGEQTREAIVQAGGFGEHRFTSVAIEGAPDPMPQDSMPKEGFVSRWLRVRLAPRATARLRLGWNRYAATPSYETPWLSHAEFPPLLQGRTIDSE